MLIVDHFARLAQAYPTQHKTARTVAEKIYHDLDAEPVYTMTKDENLRTISSVNCINCLTLGSLAPASTTLKGMGKWRQ